ncbi:MAG: hypothetical protein RIA08_09920 [Roseovarius sp.]|uniref:hypothetical protein n=1 Tax=Roseovarius sp. TaxID=1486281 RepID=UPI0032EAC091
MTTDQLDAIRFDLALHFETLGPASRDHAARLAVEEHGGTAIDAQPMEPKHGHWGPLEAELSILGVQGTGTTMADAATAWARRARRMHDAMNQEQAA